MVERARWLRPTLRGAGWIAATAAVVAALAMLSARARTAPVIIADNATIFLAADRLYDGHRLTAPPPRVPTQAWDWHCDWASLTQWPMGYPLILCAARLLLGAGTVRAAVAVSILCCGVALVGWFALVHRCLPKRLPAALIALLAAASTFSVSSLVNPASDTVLLALIPWVLLLSWSALGWGGDAEGNESERPRGPLTGGTSVKGGLKPAAREERRVRPGRLVWLGVLAGALVWVRYAAVFAPLGIGAFLVFEWLWGRRVRFGHLAVYGLAAATPLLVLAAVNRALSADLPVHQQYPVGDRLSLAFDPGTFAAAWRMFTEQTFYNHRPESVWFFSAVLPLCGLMLPLVFRGSRRSMRRFLSSPPVRLCAVLVTTCLIMLIGLSAVFPGRFDYVGLNRYYLPIKPFYFLFFLGGVLALEPRVLRALACVPLLMACSWTVNQDWARAYHRLAERHDHVTSYGRRAVYFEPNGTALYEWLKAQRGDDLLVLSNFPEDIALETRIPACPTPGSVAQMNEWIERVKRARGVSDLRVLFVLDPDNHARRYFLPPTAELATRFDLVPVADVPQRIASYVYTPRPIRSAAASPADRSISRVPNHDHPRDRSRL